MTLLRYCTLNPWGNHGGIARVFRVSSYSTRRSETLRSVKDSSSSASEDNLYSRISPFGNPNVSIIPILNKWVEEGRSIPLSELQNIITRLRNYRRFTQALQASKWMISKSYPDLSPGDIAVQLDLISKVQGLERAEQYFNNIPTSMRNSYVYSALLNCYVHAKSLDQAEATMQKLRELGPNRSPLTYNNMLKLYSQMGNHEKLELLFQEMEEKGIDWDKFTFSIQLNAYATVSDIKKMEKVLMKMESDPLICMDWNAYVIAANGYLKVGLIEKALAMLKKSEHLITSKRSLAHEILLTLYAKMGRKDEVYHVWNLYKKTRKMYSTVYLCMMSSLAKLGDLDGMEMIFEEWKAANRPFDTRFYNLLISAYLRNGLLDKAESVINMILESGRGPNSYTWDHLATGYLKHHLMEKAVDAMRKAILVSNPRWKPNLATFTACIEYLKGKGDVEFSNFRTLVEEKGYLSMTTYGQFQRYTKNEKPGSKAPNQVEILDGEMHGVMDLGTNISEKDPRLV